jgi:hypothetical protein
MQNMCDRKEVLRNGYTGKTVVMGKSEIKRTLVRIAHQIVEKIKE